MRRARFALAGALDRYADSVWRGEAELSLGRAAAADQNWSAASSLSRPPFATSRIPPNAPPLSDLEARLPAGSAMRRRREPSTTICACTIRSPRKPSPREKERGESETSGTGERSFSSGRGLVAAGRERGEPRARARATRRAPVSRRWRDARPAVARSERAVAPRRARRSGASPGTHPLGLPTPARRGAGSFRLGSLAWNRDNDERALQLFGAYARQYPTGPQAAEAIYASGRIHQEANRYSLAAREFARLARLYPKNSLAPEARFRVGWCEYRSGDQRRAADVFASIASRGGPDSASALYWNARVSGDDAAYRTLLRDHPESYYAGLAEKRLGQPPGSALSGRIVRVDGSSVHTSTCDVPDPHRTRFDELEAMSLAALAPTSSRSIRSASPAATGSSSNLGSLSAAIANPSAVRFTPAAAVRTPHGCASAILSVSGKSSSAKRAVARSIPCWSLRSFARRASSTARPVLPRMPLVSCRFCL